MEVCTTQSKNRTKRLITINCQPRSLIQIKAFQHNHYGERNVEFNEWNATTLLLILYLESLPTKNLLLNFLFSILNVFGGACVFVVRRRYQLLHQFNSRSRAAINTFKDKLSINFQCAWKSLISFISRSPSTAVVNFESDDSESRWRKKTAYLYGLLAVVLAHERERERERG